MYVFPYNINPSLYATNFLAHQFSDCLRISALLMPHPALPIHPQIALPALPHYFYQNKPEQLFSCCSAASSAAPHPHPVLEGSECNSRKGHTQESPWETHPGEECARQRDLCACKAHTHTHTLPAGHTPSARQHRQGVAWQSDESNRSRANGSEAKPQRVIVPGNGWR